MVYLLFTILYRAVATGPVGPVTTGPLWGAPKMNASAGATPPPHSMDITSM